MHGKCILFLFTEYCNSLPLCVSLCMIYSFLRRELERKKRLIGYYLHHYPVTVERDYASFGPVAMPL